VDSLYEKIVLRKRGGFCYELNGLFYWLLKGLGFNVSIYHATVSRSEHWMFPHGHCVLLVKLDSNQYIADVGFGEASYSALLFKTDIIQETDTYTYRVLADHPLPGDLDWSQNAFNIQLFFQPTGCWIDIIRWQFVFVSFPQDFICSSDNMQIAMSNSLCIFF